MKNISFTSVIALLLLTAAGCGSRNYSETDEAKVVARIVARTAPASLVFKDKGSAQHLISSLDSSESFAFGVILDSEKMVFAEYFRPDRLPDKEKFLASVIRGTPSDRSETLIMDRGCAIAIVAMERNGRVIGYAAIGRKRV